MKDALKDIYLKVGNRAPRVSKGLFLWSTFILLRARPEDALSSKSFRIEGTVLQRKLVTENPKQDTIVRYHKTFCKNTNKSLTGDVLGYVTPVSIFFNPL